VVVANRLPVDEVTDGEGEVALDGVDRIMGTGPPAGLGCW